MFWVKWSVFLSTLVSMTFVSAQTYAGNGEGNSGNGKSGSSIPLSLEKPRAFWELDGPAEYCLFQMKKQILKQLFPQCTEFSIVGTSTLCGNKALGSGQDWVMALYGKSRHYGDYGVRKFVINGRLYELQRGQELPYLQWDRKVVWTDKYNEQGERIWHELGVNPSISIPSQLSEKVFLIADNCEDPKGIQDGSCSVVVNTKEYVQCLQTAFVDPDAASTQLCEAGDKLSCPLK